MSIVEGFTLFAVLAGLAAIPSASVALVVTRTSTSGFSNGAAVVAGIVLGDILFVLLAILGVTALAQLLGNFFLILRYLAGAYLIWFGLSLIVSKPRTETDTAGTANGNHWLSFVAGLVLTLGDIKAIVFYASLLPVFVDVNALTTLDIGIIISLTLLSVGGVKLVYAYTARKIVSLHSGIKLGKVFRFMGGGLMVSSGTYLLIKT